MKLYLIKYTWSGERYIKQEDGVAVLAFESVEEANEHIRWETDHWDEQTWEDKKHRFEIVEIDVPFVRGIDR